jgi:signal transduction histidine kinase
MRYRKIFKWELFAGLAVILAVNFALYNLFINAIFKNALDSELNSRLKITGSSIQKRIDPLAFSLTPADKFTGFYKNYMAVLDEFREPFGMDITLVTPSGRVCMSTGQVYGGERQVFESDRDLSITYFENNEPQKTYIQKYMSNGSLAGYIIMDLRGGSLMSFRSIEAAQNILAFSMLAFAIVIALVFSLLVTRRIDYTVGEMEIISRGDMDRQIRIGWFDEISYLQDQINKMVRNLKEIQDSRYREIQIVAMGLAHEIKNPAAAIYNLAEIAQKGKIDPRSMENIGKIKSEVMRLNNITEKFIHFARENEIKKSPVPAGSFMDMLREQYSGLIIKYDGMTGKDTMQIDDVLMERAFKNIVKNAYEAGARDTVISVSRRGDSIIFDITDNAPMIEPSISDKIFIPFFTTKAAGMGIGLAITRNIIEKHGGRVVYKAVEGKNCFEVVLPG